MDLLPTPEQEEIIATVRSQLARDFNLHDLANRDGKSKILDDVLWKQCADLGWFGLGLTEAFGGVGFTLVEESLLFAEIGAHATPGPFLATVLGARLASLVGDTDLTAGILAGDIKIAFGESHSDPNAVAGEIVSGTFRIYDRSGSDYVLIIVDDTASLIKTSDLPADSMQSLDRLVPISIGTGSNIKPYLFLGGAHALRLRATVLVASELAGIATATAEQSTEYAKDREQFGSPIGSFQAVKHRCADMAVRAEAATMSVRYAALAVLEGRTDAAFHAHAARAMAAQAAIENAHINVQNHGGIGFTLEHTAHRYVTRAQLRSRMVGDTRSHLKLLLDQPAAL